MAAVPITINGVAYPKTKEAGAKPFPVTIVGYAWITGLKPDNSLPAEQPKPEHPIVLPPDQVEPEPPPPLEIWGGANEPFPEHPIVIPPPPDKPPSVPEKPHEGWNFKSGDPSGWYYLYVPGEGEAGPKRK